jgi:hypothetical protein
MTLLAWRDLDRNAWVVAFREALAAGRDLPTPPPGAQGPFSLADRDITTERLTAAGFGEIALTSVDGEMRIGKDVDDAWPFVSTSGITKGLTADLDDAARADALAKLRATLEAHATPTGLSFAASAWLVSARNPGG